MVYSHDATQSHENVVPQNTIPISYSQDNMLLADVHDSVDHSLIESQNHNYFMNHLLLNTNDQTQCNIKPTKKKIVHPKKQINNDDVPVSSFDNSYDSFFYY
jgi:hypothetical protein